MKRFAVFAVAALSGSMLMAQTPSDIRFNEVGLQRDTAGNVTQAWVELYNTSCSSVNMSGLYISNDVRNLKKYKVPYGTEATQFLPRGYAIIDVDGRADQGPLHTPFTLEESEMLYLVQANGRVVIDSVKVSANGSIAREKDGVGEWKDAEASTKGYCNVVDNGVGNVEKFMKVDPYGAGMALISMSVVFSVLVLLAIVFTFIGRAFKRHDVKKEIAKAAPEPMANKEEDADDIEAVAIAVALYKNQRHDSVKGKLTLNYKVNRLWKNTFLNTIINQRREWH